MRTPSSRRPMQVGVSSHGGPQNGWFSYWFSKSNSRKKRVPSKKTYAQIDWLASLEFGFVSCSGWSGRQRGQGATCWRGQILGCSLFGNTGLQFATSLEIPCHARGRTTKPIWRSEEQGYFEPICTQRHLSVRHYTFDVFQQLGQLLLQATTRSVLKT